MKKKVLITVNPTIVKGREFSTTRKLITVLDRHFELRVIPISGYDFKRRKVRAFKRLKGGAFEYAGLIEPEADLWIVYSDGYYLNHRRLGFRWRRDYLKAQFDFHQETLTTGKTRLMINSPEAEARTLKSWLATLNFSKSRVIPTYMFSSIDEVYDFQKKKTRVVVKPIWGGDKLHVRLLDSEASVTKFHGSLERFSDRDLRDYCFQVFRVGNEKRFWFAGGRFVAGQQYHPRPFSHGPWSDTFDFTNYHRSSQRGFSADLAAAKNLCELSGISMGSVDFVGDEINEINGAGTIFATTTEEGELFVDARPAFLKYFLKLADSL